MKKYFFIITLLITASLSSCGFHLRNHNDFPKQLKNIYITSNNPYGEFETTLKSNFNATGLHIVELPQQANFTLRIINTKLSHNEPTIVSSSQARLYTFYFRATFEMTNRKGKTIIQQQTIGANANLTLNPDQLLGSNNQIELAKKELYQDTTTQLLDRLSSRQMFEILQ